MSRGPLASNNMHVRAEIRRLVLVEGRSKRAVCREYRFHLATLEKILAHDETPSYRSSRPRAKPKFGEFVDIVHQIHEQDRDAPLAW